MNATDRPPLPPPDPATRYQPPAEPPDLPPPPRPDVARPGAAGSRAAAWVTGTGAFLLVVAAAVFIAVRWSAMPLELKVAIVGGLTGGVLVLGAKLQPRLPIAGRTLLHLGAFLLPVDVGALAARLDASATATTLAAGAVVTVAFPSIARLAGSRTLAVLSLIGPGLLATGVGATVAVPAPILLTVAAAAVLAVARVGEPGGGRRDAARAAVLTAVSTPVAALLVTSGDGAPGLPAILVDAGWGRPLGGWLAAAPAVIATAVLVVGARDERSRRLATAATLMPMVGLATVLVSRTAGDLLDLLALPLVFVAVEIVAVVASRDELWRGASGALATVLEGVAGLVALPATLLLLWLGASIRNPNGMFSLEQASDPAAALGVAALGAAIAAGRRSEAAGHLHAYLAVAAVLGALAVGWSSFVLVGAWLVLAIAALALARLGDATGVLAASVLALIGVLVASFGGGAARPVLVIVAVAVALLGVNRRNGSAARAPVRAGLAVALVLAGLVAGLVSPIEGEVILNPVGALPLVVAASLLIARVAGSRSGDVSLIDVPADVARLGVVVVSIAVAVLDRAELSVGQATLVLAVTAVLALADAVTDRRVAPVVIAAVPLHHLAVLAVLDVGVSHETLGAGLVAVGAVWGAAATELHRRRADGAWVAATASLAVGASVVGWGLALGDQATTGVATLALGLLIVAAGVRNRLVLVAHLGGAITAIGTWTLLEGAAVRAIEWYVLPVSVQLLAVGAQVRSRDRGVSSWLAYAPALLLFVVPAIVSRADGGSGWHTVAAGAVGVAAVVVGGWRRLGAPLVLGVATVVTVTLVESVALVSSVPTWAWLGLGGGVLLFTGIALERSGTTPTAVGRRLLADHSDRFD